MGGGALGRVELVVHGPAEDRVREGDRPVGRREHTGGPEGPDRLPGRLGGQAGEAGDVIERRAVAEDRDRASERRRVRRQRAQREVTARARAVASGGSARSARYTARETGAGPISRTRGTLAATGGAPSCSSATSSSPSRNGLPPVA
jgi:hypothetical protein